MKVVISVEARLDLGKIWSYNSNFYDEPHADRYLASISAEIQKLQSAHRLGKALRAGFRYIRLSRKRRGHAHIAVYKIKNGLSNFTHSTGLRKHRPQLIKNSKK